MSFLDQITADRRRRLPLAGLLIRGVVAATAWLLLFLPLGLGPAESWLPTSCFAALLAIYAAAALLYYLRKTPAVTPLIVTAADVVAISLLFFVTGGGSGLYVALYAIALIGATVFGSTRQTLVAALGGFVLLAAVTVALAVGVPSLSAGSGATDHAAASWAWHFAPRSPCRPTSTCGGGWRSIAR
jgi:hypothetical protein